MKRRAALDVGADAVGRGVLSLYSGADQIAWLRESSVGYQVYDMAGRLVAKPPNLQAAVRAIPLATHVAHAGDAAPHYVSRGRRHG